jgi:hypothetical protein
MTEEYKLWYLGLTNENKQIALALMANHLTIAGRAFLLDLEGDKLKLAFTGINELQHQISQHIAAIGIDRDRYPDEVLCRILGETASRYEITSALQGATEHAKSRGFWKDRISN